MNQKIRQGVLAAIISVFMALPVSTGAKQLHGHVPESVKHLSALRNLSATNELRLAIGLPLRDPAGLQQFLAEVYDPASPNYRQFLTPEELTVRFGPTEADYEAVKNFARTNGLTITAEHGNRMLLDVIGKAPAVEKAFRITLRTYRHPTEPRDFYAPDTEPTVDAVLPMVDVQGLSDFSKPHSKLKHLAAINNGFKSGTSPDGKGLLFGDDFRKAYAPGTTLTGAGQAVGLFQADGYYQNDITTYVNAAGGGRSNIVLQKVLIDSFSGNPTTGSGSGNGEVSLDIEMAMAMAPSLSRIVLFEGNPNNYIPNDILNTMAASNTIKNLSCSWGWSGGPSASTDNIFQLMAAAGQSFFNASGDTDAFVAGSNNDVDSASQVNAPSSNPYITQVGGTVLNTNGFNGLYTSESVWNDRTVNANGGNWGSSGGVSTYYSIPTWQTGISMVANGGSTTKRDIPDVALTADYVYSTYDNGSASQTGGTSCAAPLWAGFMALVNQQATIGGNPSAGFINPAVYALAKTDNYTNYFHDTTVGDNSWSSSAGKFVAVSGYDLASGWGTPVGQRLINALSGEPLGISPGNMLALSGPTGGPFSPSSVGVQLTNAGNSALNWSLVNTSAWLKVSFTNGPIAGHVVTNLDLSLTVTASNLVVGSYGTTLVFSNNTSHVAQNVSFALQVINPLSVSPSTGFTAVGPVGGAFVPSSQGFNLVNLGGTSLNWNLVNTSAWLSVSSASGPLAAGGQTNVTISVSASANALAAGIYNASITFTNPVGVAAVMPFALKVGQPVILNGGFETGDFTSWTQSGNTGTTTVTSGNTSYVHGGTYGAQLGPSGTPGYLSQNLATVMGQNYLLSLWLRNKAGTTPNLFQVQWNGVMLYNVVNMTTTAWTNLQFLVTATNSGSVLQFGFRDDPSYLGLDDITVTPILDPGFASVQRSSNSFNLVFGATTGLKYQVQYKTNLMQPAWLNLGNVITAATNTLSVTDTNAMNLAQRFYRLQVTP